MAGSASGYSQDAEITSAGLNAHDIATAKITPAVETNRGNIAIPDKVSITDAQGKTDVYSICPPEYKKIKRLDTGYKKEAIA